MGDGDGLDGFHSVLIAAAASYVYGKFKSEIDIDWLKARLRDAINKAPKREGREKDIIGYLSDASLNQDIDTAMSKFCQAVTTPMYSAPTMTPDQARVVIRSSLREATDQHFEALDVWEKVNKPYEDRFNEVYDKLKKAADRLADKTGSEYVEDTRVLNRLAHQECSAAGFEHPGQSRKLVLNLAVGVGLGKTEEAFNLIKRVRDEALVRLRADNEAEEADKLSDATRIALQRLTRATLAVPTHKLADEAVRRAQKEGLSAGEYRVRLYKDMETGEHPMCKCADSVQRCIDAALPVASSMCKIKEKECKFRWVCGYYAQMEVLNSCDVVVVAHASLFHKKPPINSRGLLIIDEQFAFAGERKRRALPVSDLRKNKDKVYSKDNDGKMVVDAGLTAKLHRYRETAAAALIDSDEGSLYQRTMWELSARDVAEAIRLEWQAVVHSPVYPGMSHKRLLKALASASAIKRMRLRVDFWKALLVLVNSDGTRKSGWLIRSTNDDGCAVVHVGGRAKIKGGWFDGLAVCLDATSAPDLVQLYFPKHEVVAPPAIETIQAHLTVLQTIDKAFSASMCIPVEGLEPEEHQRRENRAREVYRLICLRASEFRGQGADGLDVLVICQQALEQHLLGLGLPDNVEVAHFKATRGIDRWGGVRCLITVGRTLPSPDIVEVLTENLTGWAVDRLPNGQWYPRQSAGIDVGGGIGLTVQVEQHPDPMVEVVRWQICEAELIQSGGRGRGVNRLADTPLQLDVLSNVCLPMKVGQPVRWDDNAPGRIEEMVGLGLLPKGPAAAALIYPDLWPTAKAAERAASQARGKTTPADVLKMFSKETLSPPKSLLNIYSRGLGGDSGQPTSSHLLGSIKALVRGWGIKPLAFGALSQMQFAQAKVQRTNERALKFKFLFDPALIPDPEEWLTERTGFDVEVECFTPTPAKGHAPSRSDQVEEDWLITPASGP